MARSGISAAKLLMSVGAKPVLYDSKTGTELPEELSACETVFGGDPMSVMERCDALVLSPGVPTRLDFIRRAYQKKTPVLAEMELGYLACHGDFVAISGTNGKTTTTCLTGQIFEDAGFPTTVFGNTGLPICEIAEKTVDGDILVAETAALMLETTVDFHPKAAALLNLTEDHLDRFGTMEYYLSSKLKMFANQTADDISVLNYDNEITRNCADNVFGKLYWFSVNEEVDRGAFLADGRIKFRDNNGIVRDVCSASELKIPGRHNLENALAALCLSLPLGVEIKSAARTLATFPGVEHRIEFVCERDGVRYINDSKGTNPDATINAINAMDRPTILILGGFDKHSGFDELFASFTDNITEIVLLGQTRDKLETAAKAAEFENYTLAENFEDAVKICMSSAKPGMNVLLSPACASWDSFIDFEQRGARFKEIVIS